MGSQKARDWSPLPSTFPLPSSLGQDSRCMGLLKLAQLLNVVHQVAPSDILHHKIQAILGRSGRDLEARTRPPGVGNVHPCPLETKALDPPNQKSRATVCAHREAPKILNGPPQNLHPPHPLLLQTVGCSGPPFSEFRIEAHHLLEIPGILKPLSTPTHMHMQSWPPVRNQSCSGLTSK